MPKKFTEKEMLSLLDGIKIPENKEAIKAIGVDILEIEPYEKTNTRYLNNKFNPVVLSGDLFNLHITISVNEKQAEKIAEMVKDLPGVQGKRRCSSLGCRRIHA